MAKQRLILLTLTLLILFSLVMIAAANPWKAQFKVRNQTPEDIYLILYPALEEEGIIYPQLRVDAFDLEESEKTLYDRDELVELQSTRFTIVRDVYKAEVQACGMRAVGTIDLTRNLKLNFTPCEDMASYWKPKYLGEPSMEKPNWFRAPGMSDWRFVFQVPPEPVDYEFVEEAD